MLTDLSSPSIAADKICRHCGGHIANAVDTFCCKGCEYVYLTLQRFGLSSYYDLKTSDDIPFPRKESAHDRKYAYLDDPESVKGAIEILTSEKSRIRLYLSGIHCAACVWLLEKLPQVVKGIDRATVMFAASQIEIEFRPATIKLSEIAHTLNSFGYPPVPVNTQSIEAEDKRKNRQMMLRIGVAAVSASNTMMLAVSLFQGLYTGIEEPYASLFRWTSALIALPAVTYSAMPFYRTAFGSLLTGALHIDLPIAIAIATTYITGVITTYHGEEVVYFDSVTTLIFLLLIGRLIQAKAVSQARASALSPWDLLPTTVRVVQGDVIEERPLKNIAINDLVQVLPGERVPSDGVVERGSSSVDCSFLTGESLPYAVGKGSTVVGGSISIEGELYVRVAKTGRDSRLGSILNDIEHSQNTRTPAEDKVNALSSHFVIGLLLLSVFTYFFWSWYDPRRAFDVTVSLLIVTCPCALGLAIPSAIAVALGRAKKRGIFIRRPDAFEALAQTKHFYFDKTGTLTSGLLSVTAVEGESEETLQAVHALAAFAPLHPVSKALREYTASKIGETRSPFSHLKHHPGKGVEGVTLDGQLVQLGSLRWIIESSNELEANLRSRIAEWEKFGVSITVLAKSKRVIALFSLADTVAPAARELVSYLHAHGRTVSILSGDTQSAVTAVAKQLSIPIGLAKGELFPEQKTAMIAEDAERTCMICDGLNAASAMRKSDLSIGLRGGIEATIEVASLYISSGRLADLFDMLVAADRTNKIIRNNITYAVAYNVLGGALAVCGLVDSLIAAILMPVSSITVVLYAIFAKNFSNTQKKLH